MLVDIEVLRKQGGAHSREGRDKTPVKRLSRLFAHHYSLRPCACACTTTFATIVLRTCFCTTVQLHIQKWPLYCPQGSGTLRQQLLMFHGIAWYCMVLHGIAWYCIVLHGIT